MALSEANDPQSGRTGIIRGIDLGDQGPLLILMLAATRNTPSPVASANTNTAILAADPTRHFASITNGGSTNLWIAYGVAAVVSTGTKVIPTGTLVVPNSVVSGAIN